MEPMHVTGAPLAIPPAGVPAGVPAPVPEQPAWMSKPVTGEMLCSVVQLMAGRSNAPETVVKIMADLNTLMTSGDPAQAVEILKPEKRARGRPRLRPDDSEKKHRDLGSYNLFVMKAQNVAGGDVKNHRAFMALIGSFWKGMDQSTRESFNLTYKGLLDQLNEKKREGVKFDFAHELKVYERDHELDTIGYFRGFMAQVRLLPLPETKADIAARNLAAQTDLHNADLLAQSAAALSMPVIGHAGVAPVAGLADTFQGFMAQVKQLPIAETKADIAAREAAAIQGAKDALAAAPPAPVPTPAPAPAIPLPEAVPAAADDEDSDDDDDDDDEEDDEEPAPPPKKKKKKDSATKKKKAAK